MNSGTTNHRQSTVLFSGRPIEFALLGNLRRLAGRALFAITAFGVIVRDLSEQRKLTS